MTTWYMTRWHDSYSMAEIKPVEILKTTSASVWLGQQRRSKRSDYENFFESEREALDFIIEALRKKQSHHQGESDRYFDALNRWRNCSPATPREAV